MPPRGTAWRSSWAAMPSRVDSFNVPAAQDCCPASCCGRRGSPTATLYLAPHDFQHPLLAAFPPTCAGTVPWDDFPVYRYWELAAAGRA